MAARSPMCIFAASYQAMAVFAFLGLSSCASVPPNLGPTLAPAELPNYTQGDSFTFDDGRTEAVVAVDANSIRWTSFGRFLFSTRPDMLLPRIAWNSREEHGDRSLEVSPPTGLWPLRLGKVASIKAQDNVLTKSTRRSITTRETWSCVVRGTSRLDTKVGPLDTYRVVCEDDSGSLFRSGRARTYYYSPALRYYARREDRDPDGHVFAIQLVDFRTPPPALPSPVRAERESAIQSALETQPSGTATSWRGPNGYQGKIEPLHTYRRSTGTYCRRFRETVNDGARLYRTTAFACRSSQGRWLHRAF